MYPMTKRGVTGDNWRVVISKPGRFFWMSSNSIYHSMGGIIRTAGYHADFRSLVTLPARVVESMKVIVETVPPLQNFTFSRLCYFSAEVSNRKSAEIAPSPTIDHLNIFHAVSLATYSSRFRANRQHKLYPPRLHSPAPSTAPCLFFLGPLPPPSGQIPDEHAATSPRRTDATQQ